MFTHWAGLFEWAMPVWVFGMTLFSGFHRICMVLRRSLPDTRQ